MRTRMFDSSQLLAPFLWIPLHFLENFEDHLHDDERTRKPFPVDAPIPLDETLTQVGGYFHVAVLSARIEGTYFFMSAEFGSTSSEAKPFGRRLRTTFACVRFVLFAITNI